MSTEASTEIGRDWAGATYPSIGLGLIQPKVGREWDDCVEIGVLKPVGPYR